MTGRSSVRQRSSPATRGDAEERDARAHGVEPRLGAQQSRRCWRRGAPRADAVAREQRRRLVEAGHLLGRLLVGRRIGAGEVRHQARARGPRGYSARRAASSGSACIVTPRRAMPVSILRCTSDRARRGSRANEAREGRRPARGRARPGTSPRATTSSCGAAVVAAHDEDGRDDARLAQLDRLLEQRDAEAVDPRALERARDGGGAVPVARRP